MKIETVQDVIKAAQIAKGALKTEIWFRGHQKENWELIPGVHRDERDFSYETNIATKFVRGAGARYHKCPDKDDVQGWLFLMQHYRLPTRLLDWTESPLIATFFAVQDLNNDYDADDACFWALSPFSLNKSQTNRPAILSPRDSFATQLFLRPLVMKKAEVDAIVAVNADQVDARMLAQLSTFTIHGTRKPLEQLDGTDQYLMKFVIPASAKAGIRLELEDLGIKQSNLFPDLEHLATDLAKMNFPPEL